MLAAAIVLLPFGRIADIHGRKRIFLAGNDTKLIFIMFVLAVLGIGFGFFSSPNINAVIPSVGKKFYGDASGMLGTMRLTGQMFSRGMTLLLFALYIGPVQITPEDYPLFLKCLKAAFI